MPGLPGVTLTRQGPLGAFTARLRELLNEAGLALEAAGARGQRCRALQQGRRLSSWWLATAEQPSG